MLHREGFKIPELHPVATRQRFDDLVEDDVDDAFDVAVMKIKRFVEAIVGGNDALGDAGLLERKVASWPRPWS
jgi:hypothetical protein